MAQIKFVQLSQAKYDAKVAQATTTQLQNQLNASIFFTTDTRRIYKGSILYTQDFEVVSTTPDAGTAKEDRLYIVSTSGDMYIKYNGEIVQVGGNSAKISTIQQNIASNSSKISAISDEIYTAGSGIKDRLDQAEEKIEALSAIGDVGEFTQLVAGKLNKTDFNTYSSATSATLATLRSDINTNAGNISSNAADIDALESSLSALTTSSVVTVDDTATPGEGIAKVYTIKQGNVDVGTINIPKDFLVKSAVISTVVDSDISVGGKLEDKGFELGDKYIDFTVNSKDDDSEESHVYLNVKDLVDVYTTSDNATQVQLTIDSNNEISAEIVNGSITEAKLHADVQAKLAKVDGLKSAAYAEKSAFDAAGAASAVQTTVTGTEADASTALTLNGLSKRIAALDSGDNSVENQVAAASASALEAANSYTDAALSWQVIPDNN